MLREQQAQNYTDEASESVSLIVKLRVFTKNRVRISGISWYFFKFLGYSERQGLQTTVIKEYTHVKGIMKDSSKLILYLFIAQVQKLKKIFRWRIRGL